jgi:hypothetical protein
VKRAISSIVLAAISLAGGAGVALAATPATAVETYRVIACAAERPASQLRKVLDERDPAAVARATAMLDGVNRCQLGSHVRDADEVTLISGDGAAIRGMIAEAYLKRGKTVASLTALPPQPAYDRDWYAVTGRPRPLDEMATCVADSDPAGIVRLIDTEYGSSGQSAAIKALVPSLGPCLGRNYQLNANPMAIRSALAEALYHRTFDAAPAAGTQGN